MENLQLKQSIDRLFSLLLQNDPIILPLTHNSLCTNMANLESINSKSSTFTLSENLEYLKILTLYRETIFTTYSE